MNQNASSHFTRRLAALPFRLICFLLSGALALAQPLVPPPMPSVRPLIGTTYPSDLNHNGIEDALEVRSQQLQVVQAVAPTMIELAIARAVAEAPVTVELVFTQQITQKQIDDFLAQGGQISYIYQAVSFGWSGRIPLSKIASLPGLLGPTLVLVEEDTPVVPHLEKSTQTGRVRPIWAGTYNDLGFAYQGDASITIGIVDSGVDPTHTDLAGRNVYWHDFSVEALASPADTFQHGSHVAGIALGTGAASGSATGTLSFTQEGTFVDPKTGRPLASGTYYPSLRSIELQPARVTVTMTATWNGGGTATLAWVSQPAGTYAYDTIHGSADGPSGLNLTVDLTGDVAREYSPALVTDGTMTNFVVRCQVTNDPAAGDGFNKLRGVAPGCTWAGAKVFTAAGVGSNAATMNAIDALVANRVALNLKVMNLSLGLPLNADGSPGIDAMQRQRINTAVNNGVVVTVSAGNDGGAHQVCDPGRAAMALTVAAANDMNALTSYTSGGFANPGSTAGQEEDYKPDLMAPGGSFYYSQILSVDSNTRDGTAFPDQQANDYTSEFGTSMAAPFAAGCAALVIDSLQKRRGITWDFNSSQHSAYVKMLLCATATESNQDRETKNNNPTRQRATGSDGFPAGKDQYEGYGMINPDAAIEAATVSYDGASSISDTFGGGVTDRRAWARRVTLTANQLFQPILINPAGGDFDLYLYSDTPDEYGTPLLLASSTNAGEGVPESLSYTASFNRTALVVVKRVSGSGTFTFNLGSVGIVLPPNGTTAGGTAVTIVGSGFTSATAVTIGGTPVTSFTIINDTMIDAITPAHVAGVDEVVVSNSGGPSVRGNGLYTYGPEPIPAGVAWIDQTSAGSRSWWSVASSADGTRLAAVEGQVGDIWTSTDGGVTWTDQASAGRRHWRSIASSADGLKLAAAATGDGAGSDIFTSTDGGATWTDRANAGPAPWASIASSADGSKLAAAAFNGDISTSTNGGTTWKDRASAGSQYWASITSSADGQRLAAVVLYGDIYTSTDGGATWVDQVKAGTRGWRCITSSVDGLKLAAGDSFGDPAGTTLAGDIYTSTNGGATWAHRTSAGTRQWAGLASSADGLLLAAAVDGGAIYTSINSGAAWTVRTSAGSRSWKSIASSADGSRLAAVANSGDIWTSSAASLPMVTDPTSASITKTSATLGGNVTSDGGSTITERGMVYSVTATNSDPIIGGAGVKKITASGTTGLFTVPVAGLSGDTSYSFAAYATNGAGTAYTSVAAFSTLSSSVATLSGLALSAGTLSPAFASGTTSYTATVPSGTGSVKVTPTVTDPAATVTVDGTPVATGTASGAIPLLVGDNPIAVVVTAQDGSTTKTYTVVVHQTSTDATLATLTLSAGTLTPAFASGKLNYTASVPYTTTSTTVGATASNAAASVMGSLGSQALAVGKNTLSLLVTAENGNTLTYKVVVTRAAVSTNASLTNLALSVGTLAPVFASTTTSYTAAVPNGTASIKVTPTVADTTATVKINGNTVASGAASNPISLAFGANAITTVVTAQDGTTTKTYKVTIQATFRGVNRDFNHDGKSDLVLVNPATGQTQIDELNGTASLGIVNGPVLTAGWELIDVADFDGDGNPDYLLYNPATRQTAIWYLNGATRVGKAKGPTVPVGFDLVGAADFDGDGSPDLVLVNHTTRATAVWFMNDHVHTSSADGPALADGFVLVGVADFNGDSHPDFVLFQPTTRKVAVWYLNGTTFQSSGNGPVIPTGYRLAGTPDLNGDGKPDLLLLNEATNATAFWYMNNRTVLSIDAGPDLPAGDVVAMGFPDPDTTDVNLDGYSDLALFNATNGKTQINYLKGVASRGSDAGPVVPSGWKLVDVADIDGDGNVDYILYHPSTQETSIWYLDGVTVLSSAAGPTITAGYDLVATADFNDDGHPDFVLWNRTNQKTAVWFMNNNTFVKSTNGPTLPAGFNLVGVADFDGDSNPDFVLFNPATLATTIEYLSGATLLWSADGPAITAGNTLGGIADINGDGLPDFILVKTATQGLTFWYMSGTTKIGAAKGPALPAGYSLVAP